MIRKLSALASLACLLLVSGSATPAATPETSKVKLKTYVPVADLIFGDPAGLALPRWFQRTTATTHLVGPPLTQFPPSPCRLHAFTWNSIVLTIPEPESAVAASGSRDFEEAYNSLSVVLGLMAISACNVEIVSTPVFGADPISSIRPVP
jgi:hypothetical protein